jgi:predicted unusual protein kinase regulating ubiquinone biosynthesis (AarF/ABC1/UbiB family)
MDNAMSRADSSATSAPRRDDDQWGVRLRLRVVWRVLVVVYRFAPLVVAYLRDRRRFLVFGRSRSVDAATQRERAEFLLAAFLDLGPTFIKVGQILSTRLDALPRAYIDVLSRLQDRVPPADWSRVEPIIEAELGPVEEVFDAFDTDPISGASLGQVYTADIEGQSVAVKVLRPGIRRHVEADLRVIETLLPLLVYFARPGQAFTLENLAEEFTATIREEMDYVHEAAMLERIKTNFADDPTIAIPDVLDAYSTERVITMEYVDGTKIDDVEGIDAMGIDRSRLVERLEEAYIQMIVEDGLFHADPHPGNLAVQNDGTIVFYDFGITGEIDERLQQQLLDFYIGIAQDDVDAVIDAFIAMEALDPTVDRAFLRELFELAIRNMRGKGVDQYRVQQIVGDFQEELYEFPLRLPQNLALIVRVSTVLEGVARRLDPEFDFIEIVTDYVQREGYAEEQLTQVLADIQATGRNSIRSLIAVPTKLDRTLTRIERNDLATRADIEDDGHFETIAKRGVLGMVLGGTLASTVLSYAFGEVTATAFFGGLTALLGIVLYRTFSTPSRRWAREEYGERALRRKPKSDQSEAATGSDEAVNPTPGRRR